MPGGLERRLRCGPVVDLGGRTDLAELAAVLRLADCLVVGNTGPAHLAAAVGTPVVSLFAPSSPPTRWRPWGVPTGCSATSSTLRGDRARAPARSRVIPASHGDRRRAVADAFGTWSTRRTDDARRGLQQAVPA